MRITRAPLPPALCVMLLLHSVLTHLPAPVNVHVDSVNFHSVLRWDPGPGTPVGTQYQVYKVRGTDRHRWKSNLTTTSVLLKSKDPRKPVTLAVRASYNQTLSKESKIRFTAYEHTKIGRPEISLAGCGTCIQINVSLPRPDRNSGVEDFHTFYSPTYRVSVRKHDGLEFTYNTENKSFMITNLEPMTEYCIKVYTMIRVNANTEPSDTKCAFTSKVELNTGSVVVGSAVAVLIVVAGCLMTSVFLLYYTGFICKLKTLPTTMIAVLSLQGYTLTPERITPDHISISPGRGARHGNTTGSRPASRAASSGEEEEEEEEEEMLYMDRARELSSGQTSSGDVDRVPASQEAGGSTVKAELPEPDVAHQGLDDEAAREEGAEASFIPEEAHSVQPCATGVEEEEEEEQEAEVCDSSGNVDLFSVTLGALAVSEEEEQDTRDPLTDLSEPLLPTDSQQWALLLPEDPTRTPSEDSLSVCLKACDGCEDEEEEEEEEDEEDEEFSGYMRHT